MKKTLNWLFDYPNLKVYQYEEGFKFSIDSILLFEFAQIKKQDRYILDFCTGNAVIPILINYKYQKKVVGIELQEEVFQLAKDSVLYNHMENFITLIHDNILNVRNYFPGNNFDVLLCNPPYFKWNETSYVNQSEIKKIARHEVEIHLQEIMELARYVLKSKGRFYLVHTPERMDEVIVYANQFGFGVKEIQFVHSKIEEKPIVVLFTLVKDGKFGTTVYAPKVIRNRNSYQGIFDRKK